MGAMAHRGTIRRALTKSTKRFFKMFYLKSHTKTDHCNQLPYQS